MLSHHTRYLLTTALFGVVVLLAAAAPATAKKPKLGFALAPGFVDHKNNDQGDSTAHAVREVADTAKEIKVTLLWLRVQHGCRDIKRGKFDWRRPDKDVRLMSQVGVRMSVALRGPPSCATVNKKLGTEPRKKYRGYFAKFARKFVERYGPEGRFFKQNPDLDHNPVLTVEVYNEPNLSKKWTNKNPVDYGKFFVATAKQIRKAKNWTKRVKTVTGGLAGYSSKPYLKKLLKTRRIKRYADGVAIHTYGPNPQSALKTLRQLRKVMKKAGHKAPLEVTEHAWSTCPQPDPSYKRGKCVKPDVQAQHLEEYVEALRTTPKLKVGSFLWYSIQDYNEPSAVTACLRSPKHFYGLFDFDGQPKPAWTTWRQLTGQPEVPATSIPPAPVPAYGC